MELRKRERIDVSPLGIERITYMSRNGINELMEKYKFTKNMSFSTDREIRWIIEKIEKHSPAEKQDAYIIHNDIAYGIEHFQISMYQVQKKGDVSRIAVGSKENREKMSNNRDFDLHPLAENLLMSLKNNLSSYSKSFGVYKNNISKTCGNVTSLYRLVIFIEDSTESGYIVRKRETQSIKPLTLRQITEIILPYADDVWGVIYTTGNECEKIMYGCTVSELKNKLQKNELQDSNDYAPFETERKIHISKETASDDKNTIIQFISLINFDIVSKKYSML